MTTTLRVVVEDILCAPTNGIGRYTEELTRELIRTAPDGCDVSGIVSSSPPSDYERLNTLLPGLAGLYKSALARRELQLAWQHGITMPGPGMMHATSLFAPLARHDRINQVGNQSVVTVHDALAWTHPHLLPRRQVSWQRAMAKRAQKYADAVVVPTHSVAQAVGEALGFGERIRVIGGAASSKLTVPVDAAERALALELPERYLLTFGSLDPRKGLLPLIESLATESDVGLPLLVAGGSGSSETDIAAAAVAAGLPPDRVRTLGRLADANLAVALDRATVFVFPSIAEGFGLPLIEAMHFGTPVVHSDAPAVVEVAAGSGVTVPTDDAPGYPERLAQAIASIARDPALAERLRYSGLDRARAFSWNDTARQVWQLHADI